MNGRSAAALVGALCLLGLALWLPADLVPSLSRAAVLPIGAGLLVLAFWAAARPTIGRETHPNRYEPESPTPRRVPGAAFDEELAAGARQLGREDSHARQRIRERLRSVAIDVLTAYGRQTRTASLDLIESGGWTDDPVAASFVRGDDLHHTPSTWRRVNPFDTSTSVPTVVRRTVVALTRYTGRTPPSRRRRTRLRAILGRDSNEESVAGNPEGDPSAEPPSGIRSLPTWNGILALVLGSLGVGLLASDPAVLLGGTLGVAYVVFGRVAEPPPIEVTVERSIEDDAPDPGETTRVTLTVENEGEHVLPSLGVVDGVPPDLEVSAGSPRVATPLRPGERASLTYAVRGRRGVHAFDDVRLAVRDWAETAERTASIDPGETTITCRPGFEPGEGHLRRDVTQFVGQLPTDRGGDGVEFHSVREYRRGDVVSRIDWARLARTRELATVAFREERAASVVVVVDARAAAYVAPESGEPYACDRGIDAVRRLVPAFLDAGNRVGLAGFAPEPCWIGPSAARDVRTQIREALTSHPAFPTGVPEDQCYTLDWLEEFRRRHATGQVVLVSPLTDEGSAVLARRLQIYGYRTTVVGVDPTATDTAGRQLAFLERQARIHDLREAGVRVVDWAWDDPFDLAMAAATRRWST